MTTLLKDLQRGSLKEARARRRFAKMLGLNPAASWARLLQEVQLRIAARRADQKPGEAALAPAAADLDALLANLMAMQPLCKGLRAGDQVQKVELSAPLESLR